MAVAVPRFLEDFVGQTNTGRIFNLALSAVDGAGDLPTALGRLQEAEAAIATSCGGSVARAETHR
ncbi:hypothetical protein [Hyalangium sp.]|uniref:hypothetical protein n=1 Tax=Hyalangium sp. TaxID=2028555 RepID=UPI002D45E615|nr:hypothetical protein [Hyalangium sp.]HYH95055.1 hypothetical protein [Hyalangium sp.]